MRAHTYAHVGEPRGEASAAGRAAPSPKREELIALALEAARGETSAMRLLLAHVAPVVRRGVRAILGASGSIVDDACQEALLCFVRALRTFRGDANVLRFAYRIAVRAALRLREVEHAEAGRRIRLAATHATRSDPTNPGWRSERRQLLRSVLDDLPPAQAEVFALRFFLGATVEEIAEELGVPANTVKSRLGAARTALERQLARNPALRELAKGSR